MTRPLGLWTVLLRWRNPANPAKWREVGGSSALTMQHAYDLAMVRAKRLREPLQGVPRQEWPTLFATAQAELARFPRRYRGTAYADGQVRSVWVFRPR